MNILFGVLAGVLSVLGLIPYIASILQGKTKPNRATWWIWTVVSFMLLASYRSSGADHTIWVPVIYAMGSITIALLSIKYGEGGTTPFDKSCLIGSAISMVLWLIFKEPLIALLINLFIDLLGILPTVKKAYYEPESESKIAWILFVAGNTLNLFAIENWTFAITIYPLYMFLGSGAVTILIFRKNRFIVKQKGPL